MTPALEFAMIGMKASMDQLQRTGEQMAQMISENTIVQNTVNLMTESHLYEANASVVKSADELLGNLIDLFL
jgi:flagellar hook-associated protein FlgK